MDNPNFINLADKTPLFNESLWIGIGRKYPENPIQVPLELETYCDDLLQIPSDSSIFFPRDDIMVEEFLDWNLPAPSNAMVFIQPDRCFSSFLPNQDVTCLLSRPIPAQAFVWWAGPAGSFGWSEVG